jgi:molybdate transport system substrate-binding protein
MKRYRGKSVPSVAEARASVGRLVGRTVALVLWLALALGVAGPAGAESGRPPVVAAASDLQFALTEISDAFRAETGREVKLSFGSSGNFARQIRQGAPYDLFLSADEAYVLGLARDGFTRGGGKLYALGRIVLLVPHGSPLKADGTLADLKAALAAGRVTRFAIANPEHAPYGARAREALRHAGLWDAIEDKLVFGENISQAAQFATSGSTEGGIVAYSLALSPQVARLAEHALIPAGWHQPLRQRMALLTSAGETAERFYAFLATSDARIIFRRYGFVLPGEPD